MTIPVTPDRLMPGDIIGLNNHIYTVDYVEHDLNKAYDVRVIDETGNKHTEVIMESVTLIQ